jgi:glycosyltransferase involved in cell wall biosynthesis
MYRNQKIGVSIPAFNEEKLIALTISSIPEYVDAIVAIDDASSDRTLEVLTSIINPKLTVLTNKVNLGVGGSILAGHKLLVESTNHVDILVVMAGDNQMDPAELHKLLNVACDAIENGQSSVYVKGNRLYSLASFVGMPKLRLVGNVVLSFLTKLASGHWKTMDPQNGYTCITRSAFNALPIDRISKRYDFENDMLVWTSILNIPAVDVPIPARYGTETSTIKYRVVIPNILRTLSRGFFRRMWWRYTLLDFQIVPYYFLFSLVFGFIGFIFSAIDLRSMLNGISPTAGSVMLAIAPLLLSVQLVLAGLSLDIELQPRIIAKNHDN